MARVLKLYEDKSGRRNLRLKVSYSVEDWRLVSGNLVRLNQIDVPLLQTPSFIEPKLQVSGIGKKGEILELVERRELIFLVNPLSGSGGSPDGNGVWAKIKAIDGTEGWVFVGSRTQPVTYISLARRRMEGRSENLIFVLLIRGLLAVVIIAIVYGCVKR